MKFPLDCSKMTVFSGAGEATLVMAYDEQGKVTDKPAIDGEGRKTWRLKNVMLNCGGQLSTDTAIKVHTLQKLEPMKPYKMVNPVLSVWKGRVTVTADALEA